MNIGQIEVFKGERIEILEMILKNVNNQLNLSCEIYFQNTIFRITFYNISRFSVRELSAPFDVHGFEIIDHSQDGGEKNSTYEIRDFEDARVNFFC